MSAPSAIRPAELASQPAMISMTNISALMASSSQRVWASAGVSARTSAPVSSGELATRLAPKPRGTRRSSRCDGRSGEAEADHLLFGRAVHAGNAEFGANQRLAGLRLNCWGSGVVVCRTTTFTGAGVLGGHCWGLY